MKRSHTEGSPQRRGHWRQSAAPLGSEAAAYLESAVPIASPGDNAEAVRRTLVARSFANVEAVFVTDEHGVLLGATPLTKLLTADATREIGQLIRPDWPRITPNRHREEAASLAIRTGVTAVAVCDSRGRFLGAVTAESLLRIMHDEHVEDLHHMAGILGRSKAAREALVAPPYRRALYRLPWILIGFVGSVMATAVMQQFEGLLQSHIALAIFIPAIVYLADAVGTQSEAVAVRGFSLNGAGTARLLAGEVATGCLIGLTLACLAFALVFVAFADLRLALCVAISLLVAGGTATTIGFLLPWAFAHTGFDPALGSGPIATVIQDVLSLLAYFGVAWMVFF